MFEQILSKSAKESLAILGSGKDPVFTEAYLAGGTALALQLGHRKSKDLDFFTRKKFNAKSLAEKLSKQLSNFKLEKVAWGTVMGYIGETRFTIFFYDYPLLFKTKKFLGINVADAKDIAAMKIAAISDRGAKRDFVDLYFLLKNKIVSLADCLSLYDKKFKKLQQNKIHILKSLSYFVDAEEEKIPKMLQSVSWKEIKKFLKYETKKLACRLTNY